MNRDEQRVEWIRRAMHEAGMAALLCTLPSNVLLISGYWPVVGTAAALVSEKRITLIVPEDEEEFAREGWADDVRTFKSGSLKKLTSAMEVVPPILKDAARELGIEQRRVGFEASDAYEPASYVAMHVYGAGRLELLSRAMPGAEAAGADAMLARLKSVKTPREIGQIRTACRIAKEAFVRGIEHVRDGLTEIEGAARFATPLADPQVTRSGGHIAFVSGKNSASAYGAYEVSRTTRMSSGDLVLVQCNSQAHGFWTDITRTYCIGKPDGRRQEMYDAIFAAREAALQEIRPGARLRRGPRRPRRADAARLGGQLQAPNRARRGICGHQPRRPAEAASEI